MKHVMIAALAPTPEDWHRLAEALNHGQPMPTGPLPHPLPLPNGAVAHLAAAFANPAAPWALGYALAFDACIVVTHGTPGETPALASLAALLRGAAAAPTLAVPPAVLAVLVAADGTPPSQESLAELRDAFAEGGPRPPAVVVNPATGKGIAHLIREIQSVATRATGLDGHAPMRLLVEHVADTHGTGFVCAGALRAGDVVEIHPGGIESRVLGLRHGGKRIDSAQAGSTVEFRLTELDGPVDGAAWICAPHAMYTANRLSGALRRLPGADGAPAEIAWRDRWVACTTRGRGSGTAQVDTAEPVCFGRGDRLVLRAEPGRLPIAALEPTFGPATRGTSKASARPETGSLTGRLAEWLVRRPEGDSFGGAAAALGVTQDEAQQAAHALESRGQAIFLDERHVIHVGALATLTGRLEHTLAAYHAAHPMTAGAPIEEIARALAERPLRHIERLLEHWEEEGVVEVTADGLRLPDFSIDLTGRQKTLYDRVEAYYDSRGLEAATLKEAAEAVGATPETVAAMVRLAVERGDLLEAEGGAHQHRLAPDRALEAARALFAAQGAFTVAEFRDAAHCVRSTAFALLERLRERGEITREGNRYSVGRAPEGHIEE